MSGGGTGTSKDQLALQNKQQADAIAQQKAIRDQVMGGIGKYLNGTIGYDPAALSAMRSQFLNQNTANFNQAGGQVMSQLAARGAGGGQLPVGGDFTRGLEMLQAARASNQSQGILGLNVQNAQQAINNQFNAANVAQGQGAQLGQNIGTFGQGANNSLNQYVQASNSGLLSKFVGGFGSGLGSGLSAMATGGIGASFGGLGKYLGGSSTPNYPQSPDLVNH